MPASARHVQASGQSAMSRCLNNRSCIGNYPLDSPGRGKNTSGEMVRLRRPLGRGLRRHAVLAELETVDPHEGGEAWRHSFEQFRRDNAFKRLQTCHALPAIKET